MKHKLINGWTKEKVMEQFKKRNNGTRAFSSSMGRCVYRTESGNACAMGAFIPDEMYSVYMEGTGAHNLLASSSNRFVEGLINYMPLDIEGMMRMQCIHDNGYGIDTYHNIQKFLDEEVE